MSKKASRFQRVRASAVALFDETALTGEGGISRWRKFVHFWVMVWRSFVRNRCPVRASALAYATLLALIPMLAVVMSITSSLLKKEGEAGIEKFIVKFVDGVTMSANLGTNSPPALTNPADDPFDLDGTVGTADQKAVETQKAVAKNIN